MTSSPYDLDVRVGASADLSGRDERSGSGQGRTPAARRASRPMTIGTVHPMAGAQSAAGQASRPMTSTTLHPMAGARSAAGQAGRQMTSHTMHPMTGA
ncbi:hypothetical protein [Streptomyces sp. McG3]|uniref:hypothetical protein n=1 Tax=Streptomyces sp. McG3 TaxID=2725483 RepID=UPI001BEB7EB7|nr:hypothetical protein [Streptomyces sp. McG3]MBT2897896.1 hypothetical protein [Streptomyces sp. McG3]